jgi:hypothetical protein
MGWGTFIAGQAISSVRRAGNKKPSPSDLRFLNEIRQTPIYKLTSYDRELLLYWAFLGIFGGHRFKEGRRTSGYLFILTFGGYLIFWIIDGIKIGRGEFTYRDGLTGRQKNPQNLKLPKFP